MGDTKKCTKCGLELPLDRFHKSDHGRRNSHCGDCCNKKSARWRKDNPEQCRGPRPSGPDILGRCAKWRKNNPGYFAEYDRKRRAVDLEFKLIKNIRSAMTAAISGRSKAGHTEELLGCSIEEVRRYLESQFTEGMTWDNYGKNGWHVDHIIPLDYFNLIDPEQQKRAWHYTNLRPMWARDNILKSNKIIEVQLVLL